MTTQNPESNAQNRKKDSLEQNNMLINAKGL